MGKRILFALLFILASVFGVNAAKPTYSAELEQKAKSGDAFAQRDLAVCYYMGNS